MKVLHKVLAVLFLVCFVLTAVHATQQDTGKNVLDFYRKYSSYTDPGEYAYLYKELPESLTELCELIKKQFIHPADLRPFLDVTPKERYNEDSNFRDVNALLAELIARNPDGLTADRKPENRLIVFCRKHALLLASILKNRDIPTRVRYGFASYLAKGKDLHIYHVICEVWNSDDGRWMFVDPDRQMVDFSRDQFELAGDVWLKLQNGEIDLQKYGVAKWWGDSHLILDVVCHALPSVLNNEPSVWDSPPISAGESVDVRKIEKAKITILDEIAELLRNPDGHLNELKSIYDKYEVLQFNK